LEQHLLEKGEERDGKDEGGDCKDVQAVGRKEVSLVFIALPDQSQGRTYSCKATSNTCKVEIFQHLQCISTCSINIEIDC